MNITVACDQCQRQLTIAADFAGKQVQCPACKNVFDVPADIALDLEGEPYEVNRDFKHCPACGSELAKESVVCLECGYHYKTGKKLKVKVEAVERRWKSGLAFIGFYHTLLLTRVRDGTPILTMERYAWFSSYAKSTINLREYDALYCGYNAGFSGGFSATLMCLAFLGIICGLVPGLIIMYVIFFQANYTLEIGGPGLDHRVVLYEGWNLSLMKEITDTFSRVANLRIEAK